MVTTVRLIDINSSWHDRRTVVSQWYQTIDTSYQEVICVSDHSENNLDREKVWISTSEDINLDKATGHHQLV